LKISCAPVGVAFISMSRCVFLASS